MNHSLLAVLAALLCTGVVTAHEFGGYQMMSREQLENALSQDVQVQQRAVMKVKFAYYGVSCANGNLMDDNQQRSTQWIAGLCDGKTSCEGRVHNSVLTDPYPGCPKDFIAVAECDSGEIIAAAVRAVAGEGQKITLSCC